MTTLKSLQTTKLDTFIYNRHSFYQLALLMNDIRGTESKALGTRINTVTSY